MKIIVICGAGASSTFVALRLQRAADAAGIDLDASACPLASLAQEVGSADAILLGAHMGGAEVDVRALADAHRVRVTTLPADIAGDRDGSRTLALVRDDSLGSAPAASAR
ncbi:PTS sugar transporter subunit IIB [Microbacterium karelineae]|uniref:PTS sugar transporter subunit IIB n=1 Tax=Microbacterium karelineae TaxID=2654283 RepID=UPI0012EA2C33|nr:hypothetical protein [Microbacterium karelineae]